MNGEAPRPTTYWDYIKVRELLALQGGLEDDDARLAQEEVVFITVHQVYELWFKIALRDLVEARNLFQRTPVPDDALAGACRKLGRVQIVFQLAVEHFPLIETLTTRDFLEFRDKLFPANGGQSAQFREIEIVLGLGESQRIPYVTGGSYVDVLRDADGRASFALDRVEARRKAGPTFKASLEEWLYRTPIQGSSPADDGDDRVVGEFVAQYLAAHERFMGETAAHASRMMRTDAERAELRAKYAKEHEQTASFLHALDRPEAERARRLRVRAAVLYIELYRELPLLAWPRQVLDQVIALEQTMIHYRQRHARMAERIIGNRVGTGGSSGVAYLDEVALRYRVFDDLWAVRTVLVPRDRVEEPRNASFYAFRFA